METNEAIITTNSHPLLSSIVGNKAKSNVSHLPIQPVNDATIIHNINREKTKQNKIENNIIISGVKKSIKTIEKEIEQDDKVVVKSIMEQLGINYNEVKQFKRLRRKIQSENLNAETILVEFWSFDVKTYAIKNCKKLRQDNKFKGIYINPDRTENERTNDYQLRLERNERNSKLDQVVEGSNGR